MPCNMLVCVTIAIMAINFFYKRYDSVTLSGGSRHGLGWA